MLTIALASSPVLVLSGDPGRAKSLAAALAGAGFKSELLADLGALRGRAEAAQLVVLAGDSLADPARDVRELRTLPAFATSALVCVGVAPGHVSAVLAAGADDVVPDGAGPEELHLRLANAVRLRKLDDRARLGRTELVALLEIAEAATSVLDLDDLMRTVVERIAQVVPADRCSAILVDTPGHAIVVASHDAPKLRRLAIDLARYPELRRAVESRAPVVIDDIHTDPLMREVRPLLQNLPISSLVVAPLVAGGNAYGALFLRLARDRAFGEDEQVFVRAAASAVANSVRNAQLHQSVREKRDALEAAYLERYRELSALNERLREANRVKDDLLAVCSHDLRAPLNVLLGHGRLLLDGGVLAEKQRRSVEAMERQGQRVLELVERLLDSGRGRRGQWTLSVEKVDLAACARQVTGDLSIIAAERGAGLVAIPDAEEIVVQADRSAVRQILENLVTNAMSHAPAGTAVEVELRRDEMFLQPALRGITPGPSGKAQRVVVEVRDRGPGIPAAELPLVFERYHKAGSGSGLGLGLAICRELVEAHGGDIWAENRVDGGVTVTFTIPVHVGDAATREADAGGLPHVLVVEDEPDQRAILAELFAGRFNVTFARTAPEGLARGRLLRPDVMLLDVFLPGMDGLDCARALRAIQTLADVPIVFVSAQRAAEGRVRELGLPDVHFALKPLDGRALLAQLQALADVRRVPHT